MHSRRGHVFLGIARRKVALDGYLGSDSHGWGYLISQDLYHAGSRVRADYGSRMGAGNTVLLSLDTDAGTLSIEDADSGEHFGVAFSDLYSSASSAADSVLYPAFALHKPGDSLSVLRCIAAGSARTRSSGAAARLDADEHSKLFDDAPSGGASLLALPLGCPSAALVEHTCELLRQCTALLTAAVRSGGGTSSSAVCAVLEHPLLGSAGLLRLPVVALVRWHMLGDADEGVLLAVKAAFEAAASTQRALLQLCAQASTDEVSLIAFTSSGRSTSCFKLTL
jgi:SPRY domain